MSGKRKLVAFLSPKNAKGYREFFLRIEKEGNWEITIIKDPVKHDMTENLTTALETVKKIGAEAILMITAGQHTVHHPTETRIKQEGVKIVYMSTGRITTGDLNISVFGTEPNHFSNQLDTL